MANIASYDFTAADNTLLPDYSADFSQNSATSGTARIISNRVRPDTGGVTVVIHSSVDTGTDDYSVTADVVQVSTGSTGGVGVIGRANTTSAQSFYHARWNGGNVQLYKVVSGVLTQLGSNYAAALGSGVSGAVGLVMNGDQISATWNGSTVIGPITDTTFTTGGFGFRTVSGFDIHLDNLSADTLSASTPIAFTGTVPTLNGTEGAAFSQDLSSYFSGTETPFSYAVQSGTLPAGLTLNSSTGAISGTPTTAGTSSGIVVRGTDATPNTADTNSFSIVIAAAASPPGTPGTPTFSAITKTTATVTWTAGSGDVDGYDVRVDGGAWTDVGAVLTEDLTGLTPGDTVTVEVRAYGPGGDGTASSANLTLLIYGLDFNDPALDLELGTVSGSLVDLGMLASTNVRVTIQDPDTSAVVHEATVSTSAVGVLPRVEHASLDGEPYVVLLQTTDVNPLSRSIASVIMEATAP